MELQKHFDEQIQDSLNKAALSLTPTDAEIRQEMQDMQENEQKRLWDLIPVQPHVVPSGSQREAQVVSGSEHNEVQVYSSPSGMF